MSIICTKHHSTNKFSWHKSSRVFSAEISTVCGPLRARVEPFGQIYDDACDEGFYLVSHKTGKKVLFYIDSTDISFDGEITGWRLKPVDKALRNEFSVLLIND